MKTLRTAPFLLFLGIFSLFSALAEDFRDVYVWVSLVEGGSDVENQYFYDNIRMELVGGGYSLAETRENSDFFMNIRVTRKEIDDTSVNTVNLSLYDSRTENEVITLSWDYDALEDMDIWNLYLVFKAMASAPISKSMVVLPSSISSWYDKWLWIGVAGGADYFFSSHPHLDARLTVGVDFLSFMGLGIDLGYQANFPIYIDSARERCYREIEQSLILPIGIRFLIKTDNLVVEPNGGSQFQLRFPDSYSEGLDHQTNKDSLFLIPAIFGGLDFRTKLGIGSLGFGTRMIYDLETMTFGAGFTLKYQFGFFSKT
jgi:hypothetical protein